MALTKVIGAGLGAVSSADLDGAVTINESSADKDFRVESNGNANMLVVNGGTDRVGIGTNSPARTVQIVDSSATPYLSIVGPTGSGAGIMLGDTDDETVGRVVYDNSVNNLQFWTSDAEQVRIHSNGVLSASDGIALGVGTANTASNVLSDYEEGTWTMTDQSGASLSLTVYVSSYTKIGNQVFFEFGMVFPTTSDTNAVRLSLPFTAKATSDNTGGGGITTTNSGRNDTLVVLRNTSTMGVQSTLNVSATNANFSGKQLRAAGQYTT